MEWISRDYVEKSRYNERKMTLRKFHVDMEDSIFNPFETVTDSFSYLQSVQTRVESQYDTNVGYIAEFFIDNKI